jgi:Outer membrane protein beta-barrel domain
MKKVFLGILSFALFATAGLAQTGKNQLGVGAEAALPTGDLKDVSKAGIGITLKGMYGIGSAGKVTLTSGLISFSAKDELKDLLGASKITNTFIPVLAGYRHHFGGFFVEPQVGYGIFAGKIKGGEFAESSSEGAFTWAAGVGYVFNSIELGARYQSSHKDGESNALLGVRIAYNFSF